MQTTANYNLKKAEYGDSLEDVWKTYPNANMDAIDAAIKAAAESAAALPVGAVVLMSSQTSPAANGAAGTWAYRKKVNFPLTDSTCYYLYERTA